MSIFKKDYTEVKMWKFIRRIIDPKYNKIPMFIVYCDKQAFIKGDLKYFWIVNHSIFKNDEEFKNKLKDLLDYMKENYNPYDY